jgi:Reverse transcriptase (RNA-dependent DNA polymerase)
MLKSKDADTSALKLQEFMEHNRALFHNPALPLETFTPVATPAQHHITPDELKSTLQHAFKANKSSGMSSMPLQVLKHLGDKGIACMAHFLNKSAIDQLPPAEWRASKIQPIYKGKGSRRTPENYRSIAITPPFTKLLMATMNQRLTSVADALDLHAPTQAGFRSHHSTIEQVLILQTILQHSIRAKRTLGLAFIDLKRAYDSIDREKLWKVMVQNLGIP